MDTPPAFFYDGAGCIKRSFSGACAPSSFSSRSRSARSTSGPSSSSRRRRSSSSWSTSAASCSPGGARDDGRHTGAEAGQGRTGESRRPRRGGIPVAVKALLAVFVAWSFVQLLPLPPVLVKALSPRAGAIYQGLARDGLAGWEAKAFWPLSLAPRVSAGELALLLCYGLFGFLVLRTVRSRRRIEAFVLVVFAAALFQAFYGMAETFSGSERIFAYEKKYNIGSVTGTFVNRNHLAGFLEMAFPLSLGYLLAKARYFLMERGLGWRRKLLWFSQESLQWSLVLGLGTVFIGLALVFTKSRSGVLIFLMTLVLAAAAFGGWRELSDGADARRRSRGMLRLVAAAVVAVALWLGIGPVIERFGEMDISREMRRTFIANTVRMTGDFLWAGAGKGTYVDVYPMYKKIDDGLLLSYAHNDYLEVLAENGVVAGGCLIAAGVWLFAWLAGWWRKRRDNFAKGVGLGALLGVLALLVHGFTDFNLQIPANAVYFVGLCALAVNVVVKRGEERGGEGAERAGPAPGQAPAWSGGADGGSGRRSIRAGEPLSLWKASVLAAAAVALLVFVFRDFRAFRGLGLYQDARAEARSVQSAFPALERLLDDAVRLVGAPDDLEGTRPARARDGPRRERLGPRRAARPRLRQGRGELRRGPSPRPHRLLRPLRDGRDLSPL